MLHGLGTLTFLPLLLIMKKKKSPQRGIEPGSSGRKARLITIRPRWRDEIFDKKKKFS